MNISRENIDELNVVIKLAIEKADYQTSVDDVLKNHQKKAQMPGFRPGKVPAGLIKKMYGTAILVDEINKLVSDKLFGYISENGLNILGEPLPSESQEPIDFDKQSDFEFAFDIALSPEVEVNLTKKDKLPYYTIAVSDDAIDTQVKSLTGRFGKNDIVDVVGDNSLVKGDFVQLNENNEIVEGGVFTQDAVLSVSIFKDDAEKAKLIGKKVGDEVIFDPKKSFPNDTEISYLLKVSKEEAAAISGNYKFTIGEITEFVDPEFNQELFDKLFGEGNVSSEDEMRTKVKSDLENTMLIESEYRLSVDAREKLVSKLDISLPEAFLKRWMKATSKGEEKLTDEQIDNDMPRFIEDLKWQLVKNSIIKTNDLKIEDSDVVEFAKKSAKMQFMQYGLTNLPDEHIESYALDMLKNKDQGRRFAEGAINEKVMAFIKEAVKLDEKEVSRDEFNKLFENN